ncbi:MAG: glycosyltransferase family 2 protein [Flavobacteriales bacterium]|nr:glycosyltransferase family 2 protein [Flavobacteriales bacterium]
MSSSTPTPFFSVIIPTYNRAGSIGEAIQSIRSQTFTDFEVIVVDDGSIDGTKEIVSKIAEEDTRIHYIHQHNQERSAARNNGIAIAKGTYICFLDSDDIYKPYHLAAFHSSIMAQANPIRMYLNYTLGEVPFVPETDEPLELILKTAICSQQVCLHREILQKHQFNINLRIGEDQELWIRIVDDYPLTKTNQQTVVIRDLGDRTVTLLKTQTYIDNLRLKKKLIQNDEKGRIRPEWKKFMLSAAYFRLAQSYFAQNQLLKFYYYLLRSIVITPKTYFREKLAMLLNPRNRIGR